MSDDDLNLLAELGDGLATGQVIPYLGPGVLDLVDGPCPIPRSPTELVQKLVMAAPVPGRVRNDLSASAQYIESHQHRVILERILDKTFREQPAPTRLHRWLAGLPHLPLVVDLWYDGLMVAALGERGADAGAWGSILGISHPQTMGAWVACFDAAGASVAESEALQWRTVVYKPLGASRPAGQWVVSDSDLVETLTEIDIQSPIPDVVKDRRSTRGFLFLGCRFDGELGRTFARQITKRCGGPLVAVLPDELSRNEERFLELHGIRRVALPLAQAVDALQRRA